MPARHRAAREATAGDIDEIAPAGPRLDIRLGSHPAQNLLRIGQKMQTPRRAAPGRAARGGRRGSLPSVSSVVADSAVVVRVAVAQPIARLVASLGGAVEPLVHAPESIQSA